MKRGWIALILILIAAGISAAEALYTGAGTHACVALLDEADEHMERNEIAEARSLAERLDTRFGKLAETYDLFLYRSELLEVSTGMASLKRYAQTGDTAEFLATSARIRRILLSMHDSRLPTWENIL